MRALDWLCADRQRPALALAAVAWLAFMGWRYATLSASATPGYRACVADAARCPPEHVLYLALWEVESVGEAGYALRKVFGPVPVRGDPGGLAAGDTVSVAGRYDPATGEVVELEREVHRLRWLKEWLGGLGVLITGAVILRGVTWGEGGLALRG